MKSILLLTFILLFSGCTYTNNLLTTDVKSDKTVKKQSTLQSVRNREYNQPYANTEKVYQNLNGAIIAIADQLFNSNMSQSKTTSVILTSFADLNQLNKTTTFGRLLSESMFNELHIRKFNVTDFRGQDAISVNADGEFHITRDVSKLKDHVPSIEYILVGTYVKFENESVLINSRILDSQSGAIISTARVIYKPVDCSLFDICSRKKVKQEVVVSEPVGIDIITDNCSNVKCPTQQCKEGVCDNTVSY
ncbi:MAG: FlgO family outer membrane protein [Campylobacterota bacterium]|nr:FlgO family outer membrane protein [Campylobacterota bacterium]